MSQIRATRLNQKPPRRRKFLDSILPVGSWQRKIFTMIVVPFIIIFLLATITNQFIMPQITRHGSEFPLPDFSELRLVEAQYNISELNLTYEIASHEYSPGKEKGIVLNQFPIAGTKVKPGRKIKLVVSMGQKLVPIPVVAGRSVRQAMLDLESSGLVLGEIAWAFSDTLPEKIVVFSYPAADTEIPLGSPVNLMVNHGRASSFTFMPKIIGLTITEAIKRLEDKSLKAGIINYKINENYLPETVLEQSESVGTELDVDTEIDLVVSTTE